LKIGAILNADNAKERWLVFHLRFPKATDEICQCLHDEIDELPIFLLHLHLHPATFEDRLVEIAS
jgi:hypothetical protein